MVYFSIKSRILRFLFPIGFNQNTVNILNGLFPGGFYPELYGL